MKLIAVEATFGSDAVQSAVDAIEAQAESVRDMSGCEGYAHYRSDDTIAIVQKWQSMAAFDAYRQSEVFAGLGAALMPLMAGPPVTTVASVDSP
ncbi:MAG: antibiotic biosynthesis monooxygenase [Pseudomonadota bacterium]